ncbi:MAG: pectate lyase [Bryobacteraceae bacterium]
MRAQLFLVLAGSFVLPGQTREEILAAMKKASTFYVDRVSTRGGYHFTYTDDLSYGRSEHGEGATQVETQREGTPAAGMAFLEAWWASGDRFYLDAAAKAAHAGVAGQLCSGGWDYIIEFDPAKRSQYPYRADGNCRGQKSPPTTLDDNVTQAMVRLLMRVDRELEFKDSKIHEAALFALNSLLKAQYPNGAWPQRFTVPPDAAAFPVKKASYPESWTRKWPGANYNQHYTFNDNSIADAIDLFLEAGRIYGDAKYPAAAERGGGFILLAQMPEPQPAWAQQYDVDMHPAWARVFEPPSVTGGESQGILQILMVLYRETGERKYFDAIEPALGWLEKSVIPGKNRLARFYELRTNRPLYITKGTQIQAKTLGSARLDGYEVSYDGSSVITHYAVLTGAEKLPLIRREFEALRKERTPRPARLHGLSPWAGGDGPRGAGSVGSIVGGMDDRGAWVEEGVIGKADKVVSVFAAHDMVLTINGRAIPVKENDRVELFDGAQPPRQKVIRTTTFVRNLERLAAALGQSR